MIRWLERYNYISLAIAILIAITIFYFSSTQSGGVASSVSFPLKSVIYHIGIFFLLCLFLMIAMSKGKSTDWMFFAIILSFFYGLTDELHQFFVPGRHTALRDVLYNTVGIVFASLTYYTSLAWRKNKILFSKYPKLQNPS